MTGACTKEIFIEKDRLHGRQIAAALTAK